MVDFQRFSIKELSGGLNLYDPPHLIADNEARELQNVILTQRSMMTRREGFSGFSGSLNGIGEQVVSRALWSYSVDGSYVVVVNTWDVSDEKHPIAGDTVVYKFKDGWVELKRWSGQHKTQWFAVETIAPNNSFLIISTDDEVYKYNGSLYLAGIEPPTSVPTLSFNSTGQLPAGTYYYRVTFVGLNYSCESSPSAEVSITTTQTGSINLSNIPVSSDPQCSKKRIYRSRANDNSAFFLVAELDNSQTTYNDNTLDSDLGSEMEWYRDRPQPFKTAEWFKNRLWYSKGDATLYFSKPFNPQEFEPLFYIDLPLKGGDYIVALQTYSNNLLVLCRHSIWMITGDTPAEFSPVQLPLPIGCVSPYSVASGYDGVYFLSDESIYMYNGTITDVGRKISPILQHLKNKETLKLTYFPHPAYPCILFPVNRQEDMLTSTYVLFLASKGWAEWSVPLIERFKIYYRDVGVQVQFVVNRDNELVLFEDISGKLKKYGGNSDEERAITMKYVSKVYTLSDIYPSRLRRAHLSGRMTRGSYNLGILVDGNTFWQETFTTEYLPAYYDEATYDNSYYSDEGPWDFDIALPMNLIGRRIQFYIEGMSMYHPCDISGIDVLLIPLPRRMEVIRR